MQLSALARAAAHSLPAANPLLQLGASLAGKALGPAVSRHAGDFQRLLQAGVSALERLADGAAAPKTPSLAVDLRSVRQSASWLASVDANGDGALSRLELSGAADRQDPLARAILSQYDAIAAADGQNASVSIGDLASLKLLSKQSASHSV